MQMLFVYTTLPSQQEAQKIIDELIERKLIACGVRMVGDSVYQFKGQLVRDEEAVVLLKTILEKKDEVVRAVELIHPYEVPLIASWKVDCNASYLDWMKSQLEIQ